MKRVSPADEYFHNHVVRISEGFHESGTLNWRLIVALFFAWFITCLVLIRGPKSSGKVAVVELAMKPQQCSELDTFRV